MRENTKKIQTPRVCGSVAIGRNEGDRLRACLQSLKDDFDAVVYVDSGSSDGSVEFARQMGIQVVELDNTRNFTAARARNEGFKRLLETAHDAEIVQFVDGDCELFENWYDVAIETLEKRPDVAAICGRLHERYPDKSVYNRLCDMEWNTPIGEVGSCGGIAMMRIQAFGECGGFNEELIAGEEPQLCFMMRNRGWKILRIDADMGWHDAAMTTFRQWWRRNVRAGHAYAEGSRLIGNTAEQFWVHETRSIIFWGLVFPAIIVGLSWPTGLWSLCFLLGYPLLAARICGAMRRRGFGRGDSRLYAFFCTLGKFPQAWGALTYHAGAIMGKRRKLIEYK